ncbi:unnamed protein product [Prorocentrum cordatum]|uniref:Uncharacterized protein n=1 Tax=Prorocentrum cordatum TaxID=2364126 RepID=A0ABN9UBC9_9DINO|nr:unnamed protein product [Polarella glacialis]
MRVAGPLPEEQREGALATNASKLQCPQEAGQGGRQSAGSPRLRQKTSCRLAQTRTNPERERERERKKKKKKARAPGSGESGAGPISHAVLGVAVSWCMTRQCAETVFAGGVGGRREGGEEEEEEEEQQECSWRGGGSSVCY